MILHICCMYSVKYSFMLFSPFSKCFEKFLRINNGQLSLSHFAKVQSCYQLKKSNTLGEKCKSQTNSVCSKPKYRSAPSAGGKPRWNKYWTKYLFAFFDRKQTFDIFLGDMMHVLRFKFYIKHPGKCTLPESFWCIPF